MNDTEIVKALEACISDVPQCTTCKYDTDSFTCDECMGKLMEDAFDLINLQKAEIKDLKFTIRASNAVADKYRHEVERLRINQSELIANYKNIAIDAMKNFANKLKERAYKPNPYPYIEILTKGDIDNLVKEMESEQK